MAEPTEAPLRHPPQPVPPQSLLVSLLALAIPVTTSSLFPAWTNEDVGILVWVLGLIPAFLLSYHRGWRGASLALASAMAAFAVGQVLATVVGAAPPPTTVMVVLLATLIFVALGSGWLSSRFRVSLDEAQRLAFLDPGTSLPNRRHAILHLRRAFAAAQRGDPLSVVLFDLDHFKQVNDRFGHQGGDEVLREFAAVLRDHTRGMNLSARFGGEEFIAILDGVEAAGAGTFADRVLAAFTARTGRWGGLTVSAGISEYERGMASPDVLIAASDQGLYRAKRGGRDRVVVMGAAGGAGEGVRLEEPAVADAGSESRGRGEVVLIVDDDPAVARVMAKALKRRGYHALQATDPEEALAIVRGRDQGVDLLVADLVMPSMSGFRLVDILQEVQPVVRVLYISGYDAEDVEWAGVPGTVTGFLPKPIPVDRLTSATRRILDLPVPDGAPDGMALVERNLRSREEILEARVAASSAELEESHREILLRLAWAAEYRDDLTGEHAQRVGRLAGLIAKEMGVEPEQVALIEDAAPLHDLGKIAVPDSILWKPEELTAAEREVMQDHCQVGARLLSGSRHPLLQEAERIALSHHEHWDGNGYPAGLAGESIPLAARITAVADVYDSLTQIRPYRDRSDPEDALQTVRDGRGSHFDPDAVDALMRLAATGGLDELDALERVGRSLQGVRPSPALPAHSA